MDLKSGITAELERLSNESIYSLNDLSFIKRQLHLTDHGVKLLMDYAAARNMNLVDAFCLLYFLGEFKGN